MCGSVVEMNRVIDTRDDTRGSVTRSRGDTGLLLGSLPPVDQLLSHQLTLGEEGGKIGKVVLANSYWSRTVGM